MEEGKINYIHITNFISNKKSSFALVYSFLQVEATSCRRKLVCELHSLLLSCPTWIRTVVRVVTRRLALGQYR